MKRGIVICDDFVYASPSRYDVFENKLGYMRDFVDKKESEFRIGGERVTSLNNVSIMRRARHEHDVYMNASKQGSWNRYDRWDLKFSKLSNLTFVTSSKEPMNIIVHHESSKSRLKEVSNCEESFMI